MKNRLYILISTIDERILSLSNLLLPPKEGVKYVVSHQLTKEPDSETEEFVEKLGERSDILYSGIEGKGVAKNRNNALKYVDPGSICFICDDDVTFCDGAFEQILKAFSTTPDADLITFKIRNRATKRDFKPYPERAMVHNSRSLSGVGATEIAFRSDSVFGSGVLFDDCFGPGAKDYPTGEDYIFVMDLYSRGYTLCFKPIAIVSHPEKSTGTDWSRRVVFGKGAVWARVFGWRGVLVSALFALKKYRLYRKDISFLRFFYWIQRGSLDYLLRGREKCRQSL